MRRKRLTNWLLLGYLVLFLNLGPAAHRAHFFGLHGHSHEHLHSFSQCQSHNGCHGHDFQSTTDDRFCSNLDEGIHKCCHHSTDLNKHAENSGVNFSNTCGKDGTCSVCKFFDEFNVSLLTFQQSIHATPFLLYRPLSCQYPITRSIAAIARGPPIASA